MEHSLNVLLTRNTSYLPLRTGLDYHELVVQCLNSCLGHVMEWVLPLFACEDMRLHVEQDWTSKNSNRTLIIDKMQVELR
jgi:hypothetical protein